MTTKTSILFFVDYRLISLSYSRLSPYFWVGYIVQNVPNIYIHILLGPFISSTSTIQCTDNRGILIKYYTSNSNCPIRKLSLCHVSMKFIAISRLTSSISEPAFLLTMFHPMFPGEHGVEHYSRRPRETTRMTTTWPTKYK